MAASRDHRFGDLYERYFREVRRHRRLADKVKALNQTTQPDPVAVVVRRAEYDAVVEAASRLSPQDREVLTLAAWEGLPHREISQILGCSIAAVDQRLHRAKQRLAKQYHALHREFPRAAGGEEL